MLTEHPELLDEKVDLILNQLVSQARQNKDTNAAEFFVQLQEYLRPARSSGSMRSISEESELSRLLHLEGARLATLSACETGVPGIELPDEVVSLPSAFIRAGFAGAVGSLWTVEDRSTAKLMTIFYRHWMQKPGITPVHALAQAQKELRKSAEFSHPFYWACVLHDRRMNGVA